MRFFSNDNKEDADDQGKGDVPSRAADVNPEQAHDERPDHVVSDPVAVPQQRAGSPWAGSPADAPEFAGPPPAGAVAAPAPHPGDVRDAPVRDDSAVRHDGDDLVSDPGAHAADPQITGTHTADPVDIPLDGGDNRPGPALRDSGDFDAPSVVDPATGRSLDDTPARGDDSTVLKDDGTFDAPRAVDPGTDRPLDSGVASDPTPPDVAVSQTTGPVAAPAAVPVPVPASSTTPGGPTITGGADANLFDSADASSFQDRWREVQLRFVDSPKEATGEAAGLLDEAVDQLAAGLRARKAALAGGSDDTERLRVELRGYRDMLNRILSL